MRRIEIDGARQFSPGSRLIDRRDVQGVGVVVAVRRQRFLTRTGSVVLVHSYGLAMDVRTMAAMLVTMAVSVGLDYVNVRLAALVRVPDLVGMRAGRHGQLTGQVSNEHDEGDAATKHRAKVGFEVYGDPDSAAIGGRQVTVVIQLTIVGFH